jgi:hypothetical protein
VVHSGPSESERGHSGAMDGSCSDDSGIEEEMAGGGPGPIGGGPEQEDRGRIRADVFYPECWRSIHLSDGDGDTPGASGHCMCDLHMHMYRCDRAKVGLTLFMPLNRRFERRNKGSATFVAVSKL